MKNLEWIRFFRFSIVGAIGAVVDFSVMNLLSSLLNFNLVLAGTISFILAVISNFVLNRIWTYPDSRSKRVERQLFMFFIVNLVGIAIRIPILHTLEPLISKTILTLPSIPTTFVDLLSKNLTLAIAIVIVLFWNFFGNRYWTYNDIE